MKNPPGSVIRTISIFFIGLMAIEGFAFQHFSFEDQITLRQWANEAGFELYSASHHETQQQESELYTRLVLQALHTTRPEQFYLYLARLIISARQTAADDDELLQLLQPVLNLNKTQERVFETFILEQNNKDLADWLRHYMDLEKRLSRDEHAYAALLELLTGKTVSRIQLCPEMLMLDHVKGTKAKRHTILHCVAQSLNLHIIDIDVSQNRIVTSRISGPEPTATSLLLPPPTALENSEQHISTTLDLYNTPTLQPVILLISPLAKSFLIPARKKTKRPPVSPLTESDIEKIRQKYKNNPPRTGQKRDKHFSSWKPGAPHWLQAWFTSPGYSIAAFLAIGVIVTLLTAYSPYPGNPWLPLP